MLSLMRYGEMHDCLNLGEQQRKCEKNVSQNPPIGANPEKSDLVNFRGPDWKKFSELGVLLFSLGKADKMLPKSRFGKPIFGHSAGSTKLDRPYCKPFWVSVMLVSRIFACKHGARCQLDVS